MQAKGKNINELERVPRGTSVKPRPKPLRLTLDQRRKMARQRLTELRLEWLDKQKVNQQL
jgi:hypothetical protein